MFIRDTPLTLCSEARYGRLLARYLDDPGNLFVISSDFCHWGMRFAYQFHDESKVQKGAVACCASSHHLCDAALLLPLS